MSAYISSLVSVETADLTEEWRRRVKNELTFESRSFETSVADKNNKAVYDEPTVIEAFTYTDNGRLLLPYAWAVQKGGLIDSLRISTVGATNIGVEMHTPKKPSCWNNPDLASAKAQFSYMQWLQIFLRRLERVIGVSPTGTGKTICALWVAAELKRRLLVVVHRERLLHQWKKAVIDHLGVPEGKIGILQGDKNSLKNAWVGLVMAPTLVCRDERDIYPHLLSFGTVIYDEVHRFPTETLNKAFKYIACRYQLGLTATLERSDGMEGCITSHIGRKIIKSSMKPLDMEMYFIPYKSYFKPYSTRMKLVIPVLLSKHRGRNDLLVKIIKKAYVAGKRVLVLSSYVNHLTVLRDLCAAVGLPPESMGMYVGKIDGKKVRKEEYDRIKKSCEVVFATVNIFSTGLDFPDLEVGVEAVPMGNITQACGRIRRFLEGKNKAYWVSIDDYIHPASPLCGYLRGLSKKRRRVAGQAGIVIKEAVK